MIYKEVFQLAQEKGFKKVFSGINYTSLGEEYALAELTLIQKFLRDEHKIDVCINPHYMVGGGVAGYLADVYHQYEIGQKGFSQNGYTYEEALLQGIHEALKLLP